MFYNSLRVSLLKRAIERDLLYVELHHIRDYSHDSHHTVDDYQYGGGPGMVLKPEPVFEAVEAVLSSYPEETRSGTPILLLSPQGRLFNQGMAEELAKKPVLALICGRYEGVDERVSMSLATDEVSIGDYVLSGGELAAMVIVEAVSRLIPGVVGSQESVDADSITSGLLQYPLYTRPPSYKEMEVPSVLLSGDHQEVAKWRRQQSLLHTLQRRPELLEKAQLTAEDLRYLESLGYRRN